MTRVPLDRLTAALATARTNARTADHAVRALELAVQREAAALAWQRYHTEYHEITATCDCLDHAVIVAPNDATCYLCGAGEAVFTDGTGMFTTERMHVYHTTRLFGVGVDRVAAWADLWRKGNA